MELRKLVGSVVVGVECWSPAWDLEITFDNGRELVVFADFVQPEASANQNWELSVPGVSVVVTARSELVIDRH